MTTMNIEVEMPQAEQLALIATIDRVLRDHPGSVTPTGRRALHKVREAAKYAVEVKNAQSMEAAS